MSRRGQEVDRIYVAASSHDARFTRICISSIRYFYPETEVRILAGGALEPSLVRELSCIWNVQVADLPRGDYGWGFVKLEPLFGASGERFLVLDSDTVMTGPVLEVWSGVDAPFLVDDEAQSDADARRLYYDWEQMRDVAPEALRPAFVFNSGQWFGTAGLFDRRDFDAWLEWTMPPRLRRPDLFMPGDQGVLNYVMNQKAAAGMTVARRKLMRWPGHGMQGLRALDVVAGKAPALVVHWAGMKRARHAQMVGADLLTFFERQYYARLSGGELRRRLAAARYILSSWAGAARTTARLAWRRLAAAPASPSSGGVGGDLKR
jgi:hypothetical protein